MTSKLLTILISLTALIAFVGFVVYIDHRESLLLDGTIQISSLEHPVKVYFDRLDIPYIEASSEKDLTIAQGFITASQRLFQMDILRRIAKGETAAIFGNSCLPNDKLARLIGFKRIAKAEYPLLLPETKTWLDAYCQGINSYISQSSLSLEFILLGYEPQTWLPEDTLAILKYLQYTSDECWQLKVLQNEIAKRGGIELAKQLFGSSLHSSQNTSLYNLISTLPPPAQLSWGSHAWTISQDLSKSEKALLACDKDTFFNFPDLFSAISLRTPSMHVAGLTIPGIPGILIGRNDYFSWTAINLKIQSQELCPEEFSDKTANQYINKQGVFQAKEIKEEIQARFAPTRLETILLTKDGPILTKNNQTGIALNWYGADPNNNTIDSILPLNRAKNWSEFKSALDKYKSSLQIFLYADIANNIGKYISGYNRHSGQIEKSPKFIVATEGHIYPMNSFESTIPLFSSGHTSSGLRAEGILANSQTLKTKLSLENMVAMQADIKAPLSELIAKTLHQAYINTKNTDKFESEAIEALNNWDGQLRANSPAATIYESYITALTKKILKDKIGEQLTSDYINKWPYWTQFTTNVLEKKPINILPLNQNDFSIFCLDCLSQSLKNLRLIFQTGPLSNNLNKMQWQKLHQIDFQSNLAKFIPFGLINIFSPFIPETIGVGGDQDSLNACNYQLSNTSPLYTCNSGPTARLLIDMADNDKFYHSLTSAQSGHLFSKDRIYNDQLKSWCKMEFHPLSFSQKQLELTTQHILLLDNKAE